MSKNASRSRPELLIRTSRMGTLILWVYSWLNWLVQVCLRSLHQGPKIDVWSAGVTLLYLMTGRAPFTGDPEQLIFVLDRICYHFILFFFFS